MTRLTTTITSFNGGEVTPLLDGRVDLDFYSSTAKKILNFIPRTQGPIQRRKGLRYIAKTKEFIVGDSSRVTKLWPFIFAVGDAYVLEFGDKYIRFYVDQAQVMNGLVPLEIVTPYSSDDLSGLQFAQVGDLLYIVHPSYPPHRLSRTSLTPTFTIEEVPFRNGPTLDENEGSVTLSASATTGTVTITASAAYFNANMVGGVWAISEPSGALGAYAEWDSGIAYALGAYVRNEGAVYLAATAGVSGTIPPTHKRGTVSDGGVSWTFVNNGTGYIKFTTYISPTQFTGIVQLTLPSTAVGTPTLFWNEGAWSNDQGWPQTIAFYEQRAFYGGNARQPQTIWASKTNRRYEDFDTGNAADDDSLVFTAATNEIDTIKWLGTKSVLLAGTAGGVFVVRSSTIDQVLTPSNVQIKKNTSTSCSSLPPELVNNILFFIHRAERKILGASYSFENDSFVSEDFTIRAEHITESGVLDLAYQQEPYSILWVVLRNGEMIGLTIEQGQKVAGWHRHATYRYDINGELVQDQFESVVSIPTATTDELWVVVKREVDGEVVRYVEMLEPDESRTYYVDSGKYYEGASVPAGQYGGFEHLIGERVSVLLTKASSVSQELAVTDDQVVNSLGEITLPYDCTKIVVGLPYFSDYMSSKLVVQIDDGISLSKPTRIHKVTVRVLETLGFQIGYDENHLQTQPFRKTFYLMDNPPNNYGINVPQDYVVDFNGTWNVNYPTVYIRQAQPLPATIISMSVILNAYTQ